MQVRGPNLSDLDYPNDDVSAAVEAQATQRSIIIQALETDVPLLSWAPQRPNSQAARIVFVNFSIPLLL